MTPIANNMDWTGHQRLGWPGGSGGFNYTSSRAFHSPELVARSTGPNVFRKEVMLSPCNNNIPVFVACVAKWGATPPTNPGRFYDCGTFVHEVLKNA